MRQVSSAMVIADNEKQPSLPFAYMQFEFDHVDLTAGAIARLLSKPLKSCRRFVLDSTMVAYGFRCHDPVLELILKKLTGRNKTQTSISGRCALPAFGYTRCNSTRTEEELFWLRADTFRPRHSLESDFYYQFRHIERMEANPI